ncbi:alpha/beta hydrolase family protein [Dyella amyloliquefaciens]|uniref:alpha/beta hydrolase family protein n=1 Tax=Dyella amyloliquefaciens TaxID=1770545 RepID=UPI0013EE73E8|nr:prolyl oligopeptidase family serine peptidase [Dyella amyloliquefaciens]
MMEALPLDDVPAVKVYLGLPLFGERAPAGGMKELARRQAEDVGLEVFKPVVVGAGDELSGVARALQQQGCLRRGEAVGLVGFSAGGAATLYALAQRKWPVDSAVLINASTGLTASVQAFEQATGKKYAWSPASRELAQETDAANHVMEIARGTPPPALLFLRGADDSVIDAHAADDLEERLKPLYRDHAKRLQFTQLQGMSHQWAADPQSLADVRKAVAEWFTAR